MRSFTRTSSLSPFGCVLAASSAGLALVAAGPPAFAQATTATGTSIGPSLQQYPERFINGNDVGQSTRPQNLTPLGINFDDCNQDMVLDFKALVTLTSGDTVQTWASTGTDCTQTAARGIGGVAATCWRLPADLGSLVLTNQVKEFKFRVQDMMAGYARVLNGQGTTAEITGSTGATCATQSSSAANQFHIFIMGIGSDGQAQDGTFWNYTLPVDVLGPNPPVLNAQNGTSGGLAVGDTLLIANWTPNTDSDTGGYDVFVDPPPGSVAAGADASDGGQVSPIAVTCVEAGASVQSSSTSSAASSSSSSTDLDASGGDSGDDGASAASSASSSSSTASSSSSAASSSAPAGSFVNDAGLICSYVSTPPPNGTMNCPTTAITQADVVTSAGTTTFSATAAATTSSSTSASTSTSTSAATSSNDLGTSTSSTSTSSTPEGAGANTLLDCKYLVGTSCPTGQPAFTATNESVTGESNGTFTIKGLVDGVTYNVAVAAVDNFGNVGAPSAPECQSPQPINDFFDLYKRSGGGASGFCSIDAVGRSAGWCGMGFGAAFFGVMVGRRRKGRRA